MLTKSQSKFRAMFRVLDNLGSDTSSVLVAQESSGFYELLES